MPFISGGGGGGSPLDGVLAYLSDAGGGSRTVNPASTIPWDATEFDTGGYLAPLTGKFAVKAGIWRVETTIRASGATPGGNERISAFFDGPPADQWLLNLPANTDGLVAASGVVLVNVPSADVWDMTLAGSDSLQVICGLIGSRVALTYLGPKP